MDVTNVSFSYREDKPGEELVLWKKLWLFFPGRMAGRSPKLFIFAPVSNESSSISMDTELNGKD